MALRVADASPHVLAPRIDRAPRKVEHPDRNGPEEGKHAVRAKPLDQWRGVDAALEHRPVSAAAGPWVLKNKPEDDSEGDGAAVAA
jgi:hypothetical protein